MTLRARLLLAAAAIMIVVSVGAVAILRTQEAFLTDQIDDQLRAAAPLSRPLPADLQEPAVDAPPPPENSPISELYIGIVDGRIVDTILQGRLLDDAPAIDPEAVQANLESGEPFTVTGQAGTTRFRVITANGTTPDTAVVFGLPLNEVDRATTQLRWALLAGVTAVALVLLTALWWVQRLGIRPITRLTALADAVVHGDRSRRAGDLEPRTEAGRLGNAINVMLDERDADDQRLRRFVADASHELRTPLTSIRGYLDLWRDGALREPGEFDDVLRRLSHESARMRDLIEDLLLLAHLDEHRPLRNETVDLRQLITDCATDARALQPERPIEVDVPAAPVVVAGDPHRLEQVVVALTHNALTHTSRDARLRLSARSLEGGAELVVADTGAGVAPEDAARMFDRFYRGDPSRTRATGGSGLGLSISKSIIDAHGGAIDVVTAPGAGCTVTIQLPDDPPIDHPAG